MWETMSEMAREEEEMRERERKRDSLAEDREH